MARVHIDRSSSPPHAFWVCDDGRRVSLHSRRDPLREASRWVASARGDRPLPPLVIVIGAGLGYVVDVIERDSDQARVLVVEPDAGAAHAMLARRSWAALLDAGRLRVLAGLDDPGVAEAWKFVEGALGAPLLLVHPVVLREALATVVEARRIVDRILFDAAANTSARRRFEPAALRNTLGNLPVIAEEGNARDLDDLFSGVPAVIVGAGPSLDHNVHHLKVLAGRVLVIATDTAARPLLAAGVTPNVVVAVDPGGINARHLDGLPPCPETFLVGESGISPETFAAFRGRAFVFRVGDHAPWPWLAANGVTCGTLRAWGSVVTSALDLALRLGCSPIAFAGLDLAFTDARPYCRGTAWEDDWARAMRETGWSLREVWQAELERQPRVRTTDLHGHPVWTTPTLQAFRRWLLEAMAKAGDRKFFNLTGAGILFGSPVCQADPAHLATVAAAHGPADLAGSLRHCWDRSRRRAPHVARAAAALLSANPLGDGAEAGPYREWRGSVDELTLVEAWTALARRLARDVPAVTATGMDLAECLVARRAFSHASRVLSLVGDESSPPRVQYLQGFCLHMSGEHPEAALAYYDRALGDTRLRYWALAHRAMALLDLGRTDDARLDAARLADLPRRTPAADEIYRALDARLSTVGDSGRTT